MSHYHRARILDPSPRSALLFVFFWLILLRLPDTVPSDALDISWASALAYFTAQRLQFGNDIIFTFGPLGFLYTTIYTGYLFGFKIVGEFALKGIFAIILVTLIQRSSKVLGALLITSIMVFSFWMFDYFFFFTITYGLILLSLFEKPNWLVVMFPVIFAILSLIKISFLVSATAGLLILSAYWSSAHQWKQISVAVSSYYIALIFGWLLAGQDLFSIVPYLQTGLYVSLSYTPAMSREGLLIIELLGIFTFLVVGVIMVTMIWWSENVRSLRLIFILLIAQGMFFGWKYGYVRSDPTHIQHFFLLSQLLITATWYLSQPTRLSKRMFLSLTVLSLCFIYSGLILNHSLNPLTQTRPAIWSRLAQTTASVLDFADYRKELLRKLQTAQAEYALPHIKARVGHQTLDVFGFEQGVGLLNAFNYRPRPAFQSYVAHHPSLLRVNGDYYRGETSPQFILFKLQTIDDRFPAADDSQALDVILSNYTPITSEQGYVLWKKNELVRPFASPQLWKEETAAFNEVISLPIKAQTIWLSVEWQYTWYGKIIELLYKLSQVRIEITTGTGEVQSFRLVAPVAATPFLINPFLRTTNDVVDLVKGKPTTRTISFRLIGSSPFYKPRFRYKLFMQNEASVPGSH